MAEVLKEHAPNVDIQRDYDYASVYRIWCDATFCDFVTDGIEGEARVFEAFADHQVEMLTAAGFGPGADSE